MAKRKGDRYGYPGSWCVHYRSPNESSVCGAGIPSEKWAGTPFANQPCFLNKDGTRKTGARPCTKLRCPTSAEIMRHQEYLRERVTILATAMPVIAEWREARLGKGGVGVIVCPVCSGRLHLSMARSNGHISAKCETDECVEFIQ